MAGNANSEIDAKLAAIRQRQAGTLPVASRAEETPAASYEFAQLDLVKTTGERWAFPFSGMASQQLDSGKRQLTLRFTFHEVRIKGRCLEGLYAALLNRTVGLVSETTKNAQTFADSNVVVVDSLDVSEVR